MKNAFEKDLFHLQRDKFLALRIIPIKLNLNNICLLEHLSYLKAPPRQSQKQIRNSPFINENIAKPLYLQTSQVKQNNVLYILREQKNAFASFWG
jgi:uncharacterized protein YneF (UPF0154 family)